MTYNLVHTCLVNGCDAKHRARGYCAAHYKTLYLYRIKIFYFVWHDIKNRCYNEHFYRYDDWGGRGIKMYDDWKSNYWNFHNWIIENIGDRPTVKHQLDRIDNNGNYEPGNLKWSTSVEQGRNRRVRRESTTGVRGVEYRPKQGYVVRISVDKKRIYLGSFDSLEKATSIRLAAEQMYWH